MLKLFTGIWGKGERIDKYIEKTFYNSGRECDF